MVALAIATLQSFLQPSRGDSYRILKLRAVQSWATTVAAIGLRPLIYV